MVWRFCRSGVAVAALVALSVPGAGCRRATRSEAQEVTPELELTGVRFRVYRGDTLRASGEADRVSLRRDSTDLSASGLSAVLPAEGRGEPVRISAPQGQGVVREGRYAAAGGVTVARGEDVATTEAARFDPSPGGGIVRGDDPVVVEGKGYRLTGPGFELDPRQGEITIRGGARLEAALAGAR
jgi:hypothetical protein